MKELRGPAEVPPSTTLEDLFSPQEELSDDEAATVRGGAAPPPKIKQTRGDDAGTLKGVVGGSTGKSSGKKK